MGRLSLLLTAVMFMAVSAARLWAHGTPNGTWLTNAKAGAPANPLVATNAGNLSAVFTNASGMAYYGSLASSNIVTKVTQGYDLAPVLVTSPSVQSGSAGGSVVFTAILTNWGNGTAPIGAVVTNLPGSFTPGWTNAFVIYLNGTGVSSNIASPRGWTPTAPGGTVAVAVRVKIPASMPSGATNRFIVRFGHDRDAVPVILPDAWPGVNAIPPATPDVANLRDFQEVSFLVRVEAPALVLSKSADVNVVRPFEDITYTIRYTNSGSTAALGVRIQDVFDRGKFTAPFDWEINHNNGGWVPAGTDATVSSNPSKYTVRFTPNAGTVGAGEAGLVRFKVRVR